MDLSKYIKKTASCPTLGDWAIANKLTKKWSEAKPGDVVLYDFNGNGTSDHTGIVVEVHPSYIMAVEGNTGGGSDTNGDGVYLMKRTKANVNYFIRTKLPAKYVDALIATAKAQIGYKEGRNNNNKYGKEFGQNNQPWCAIFVWWCFKNCKGVLEPVAKPDGKYSGNIPTKFLEYDSAGTAVAQLQKFLNWYHPAWKLVVDGEFGAKTEEAVKIFQLTEGIASDGQYGPISAQKAASYKAAQPPSVTPSLCIDTSYWQGKVSLDSWQKVAKKCRYAIHRASYTSQAKFELAKDSTFANNFTNAQKAGLKCGAYHYSQAVTVAEAKKEAEYLCDILAAYRVDFFVACDYEFGGRLKSDIGTKASEIANAFCDVVKAHGYTPVIYANLSMLNKYLTRPAYPVWVAQYNDKCDYTKDFVMWQYTSSGSVEGITGRVDLSKVYDVPEIKPTAPQEPKKEKYTGVLPDFVALSGDIIANLAKACAWPLGTAKSKYAYLTGSRYGKYTEMLDKAYPTRAGWGARPRAGASCDVFVGTIVRAAGVDKKYPRGLEAQHKYTSASLTQVKTLKRGDVVRMSSHTLIIVEIGGKLYEAEASYGPKGPEYSKFPAIYQKASRTYPTILRCNRALREWVQFGDTGEEVVKLQQFLNWYGGYKLILDGDFGELTEKAVRDFQTKEGLTVDGKFGKASTAKAKEVTK